MEYVRPLAYERNGGGLCRRDRDRQTPHTGKAGLATEWHYAGMVFSRDRATAETSSGAGSGSYCSSWVFLNARMYNNIVL